jgi:hypothetical protein
MPASSRSGIVKHILQTDDGSSSSVASDCSLYSGVDFQITSSSISLNMQNSSILCAIFYRMFCGHKTSIAGSVIMYSGGLP